MVECFDRIHLQLTEVVLRPLRALSTQLDGAAATVRLPGRGCRIDLTVTKSASNEPSRSHYSWTAVDSETTREWSDTERHPSPDAAYWAAVDLIGETVRQSAPR